VAEGEVQADANESRAEDDSDNLHAKGVVIPWVDAHASAADVAFDLSALMFMYEE